MRGSEFVEDPNRLLILFARARLFAQRLLDVASHDIGSGKIPLSIRGIGRAQNEFFP